MDFDIPVPRVTRRPKRPKKKIVWEERKQPHAIGNNNEKNFIPNNNNSLNGASSDDINHVGGGGGSGNSDQNNIQQISISSSLSRPSVISTSGTIATAGSNINAAPTTTTTTRTNLVSSPNSMGVPTTTVTSTSNTINIGVNNQNNRRQMPSTNLIATAAAVRTRSLSPAFQQRRSVNGVKRPLCVGDFIKGLRDGEPTQAVREREASRKRRRGKGKINNNNIEKNNNSQKGSNQNMNLSAQRPLRVDFLAQNTNLSVLKAPVGRLCFPKKKLI